MHGHSKRSGIISITSAGQHSGEQSTAVATVAEKGNVPPTAYRVPSTAYRVPPTAYRVPDSTRGGVVGGVGRC